MLRAVFLSFFLFFIVDVTSQATIDRRVSLKVEEKTLVEILYLLSKEYKIDFYFNPDGIPYYVFNKNYKNRQLWEVLQDLFNGTKLKFLGYEDNGVVIMSQEEITKPAVQKLVQKWKSNEYGYPFEDRREELTFTFGSKAQVEAATVALDIYVFDQATGLSIIGAVIRNEELSITGSSDNEGKIGLRLNPEEHQLLLSYTGYQDVLIDLNIYESAEVKIPMKVQSFLLDEIEISSNTSRQKVENSQVGAEILNIKKLELIPQVMGSADLIKSLELLPGVTTVGEISSGFNVRGGNIDESLVLLNDGMIFNPTHVIGFISAFNSDAIKSASLYKGYIGGEYGNRSSAVLDLNSSPGINDKINGKGGVGTAIVNLMLEGPLSSKLSFLVSGRASFSDYLLDQIPNVELQNSSAQFYDGNFSLNYRWNEHHNLQFNGYYSDDFFEYNQEFGFEWQNKHLGLQWRSTWSDRWYSKLSLNWGGYASNQFTLNSPEAARFMTDLSYLKGLLTITRSQGENGYIKTGVEYIDYNLAPDELIPSEGSALAAGTVQRKASIVLSPFLAMSRKLSEKITIEASIRWSNYYSQGPGQVVTYGEGLITELNEVDRFSLQGIDHEGIYRIWEPRLSFNYKANNNWSIKGGYNKLSQNTQLISISNTALPTDYWAFSDRHVKPQEVQQGSLGIFHTDEDNRFSFSLEGFYKVFDNANILRDFPSIILNDQIETILIEAEGHSYGTEFFFEKSKGKLNGSIAYTFSRTKRRSLQPQLDINNNELFPTDFDIPHQLNLLLTYKLIPSFSFNFAYAYKSGRPISVPEATILQDNFVVPIYSERNQERIPNYQRVDLSITLDLRKNKRSGFRSSFTFGIYNLLGRDNAYNVFFRRNERGRLAPFQFSLIASPVPNLSWNFVF